MALFLYFDKEFNFVMSEDKMYVTEIRPGYHCVIHVKNYQEDYIWFDFTKRTTHVSGDATQHAWNVVVRDQTKFPKEIQAYLLIAGE